jgi:hypothetical protein
MDNQSMFELSKSGEILCKKIVCYMDEGQHMENPEDILSIKFEAFQLVKDVRTKCPFDESIELVDVKLDVYGP